MKRLACHSTKNRSYGRNLLTCENFVVYRTESSNLSTQNPQHFLYTCDFAIAILNNYE